VRTGGNPARAQRLRILLGQLGKNGDCLYATALARQIKQDFPDCHLTWAVGSPFRDILKGNPFVDEVWEYPMPTAADLENVWPAFAREARARARRGEFDRVFLTQVPPDNYARFDGTVRASIFRGYPHPVTVPIAPVVRLTEEEVRHAEEFTTGHAVDVHAHRILFECAGASRQTFLTPAFASAAAQLVLARVPDAIVILTSNIPVASTDPRIVDASVLTLRENAQLTRHCTLLVGGSSGITWLATSDWARPLPMIQLLSRRTSVFASVLHDAEHFGLPTGNILEMTECEPAHLAECIVAALTEGFAEARSRFHERIPVRMDVYLTVFIRSLIRQRRFWTAARSLWCTLARYGPAPLALFLKERLVPPPGHRAAQACFPRT